MKRMFKRKLAQIVRDETILHSILQHLSPPLPPPTPRILHSQTMA